MGGFNPVGTPNTVYYPLGLVTTPQNTFWTEKKSSKIEDCCVCHCHAAQKHRKHITCVLRAPCILYVSCVPCGMQESRHHDQKQTVIVGKKKISINGDTAKKSPIIKRQTHGKKQPAAAAAVLVFETSPCCDTITSLITTTARNTHSSSKQSYPLYRQQQQETMMKSYLAFFFLILSLATTCYVANAARRSTTTAPATSAHTKKGETNIFAFSVGECAGKSMERIRVTTHMPWTSTHLTLSLSSFPPVDLSIYLSIYRLPKLYTPKFRSLD